MPDHVTGDNLYHPPCHVAIIKVSLCVLFTLSLPLHPHFLWCEAILYSSTNSPSTLPQAALRNDAIHPQSPPPPKRDEMSALPAEDHGGDRVQPMSLGDDEASKNHEDIDLMETAQGAARHLLAKRWG